MTPVVKILGEDGDDIRFRVIRGKVRVGSFCRVKVVEGVRVSDRTLLVNERRGGEYLALPVEERVERRRVPRVEICLPVKNLPQAQVRDLSLGGARVRAGAEFQVGDQVTLEFDVDETPLRVFGEVCWRQARPGTGYEFGLSFVRLRPSQRQLVGRLLSSPV